MRLWLDDLRDPTNPYIIEHYGATGSEFWAKTVEEAKAVMLQGQVVSMSLDHDLGDGNPSGADFVSWLQEMSFFGKLKIPTWRVHSDNPPGRQAMILGLQSAERMYGRALEDMPP